MLNNWIALTRRLFYLKDSIYVIQEIHSYLRFTLSRPQSSEPAGRWRPSHRSVSEPEPASMVSVPGCGLVVSGARDNTMSSPGPGQSHSDLGHSDTPETHEETSGGRRQRAVTSDEHHGAQPGDHGGAGDPGLGEHSHGPGGGAGGRGSGRALPWQLHCPGQLPVQLMWTRVQPGVPTRSVEIHFHGCGIRGGEKKWSNYGFTIRSERDRVTHVAT